MDSYEHQPMISAWNRYLSPTNFLCLTSRLTLRLVAAILRPESVFSSFWAGLDWWSLRVEVPRPSRHC